MACVGFHFSTRLCSVLLFDYLRNEIDDFLCGLYLPQFCCIGQVVLGSKHADFVEMKVHGLEARVNKRELKPGTQIKKFLMTNSDLCPNRITMTRWSLEDRYVTLPRPRFQI